MYMKVKIIVSIFLLYLTLKVVNYINTKVFIKKNRYFDLIDEDIQ